MKKILPSWWNRVCYTSVVKMAPPPPPQWYPATVTAIVRQGKRAVDTKYSIKYDDEEGFYTFKLLVDLKKGDLILL
jgi:hypothetical protein